MTNYPQHCDTCFNYVRQLGKERCRHCIEHQHEHCVQAVEMGVDPRRGRPKDRRQELRSLAKQKPYWWLCGCTCGFAKVSEADGSIAS